MTLSEDDVASICSFHLDEREVNAGQDIVRMGDRPEKCFLLSEGLTCMYKIAGTGERQIVGLQVTGDMPDLQSLYLESLDVSISAVTKSRLIFIAHDEIQAACLSRPQLTRAFWRMSLIDGATAREWILNIGQRDGTTRLAHVLCELYTRLDAVGLTENGTCPLPITQVDLADVTGMTPVHVNRTLQVLRADGYLQFGRRKLTVPDFGKLAQRADFDPTYLQLPKPRS